VDGGRVAILPGQASAENARVLATLLGKDVFVARQRLSRPDPDVHRFATRDEAARFARTLQDAGFAVVAFAEAALASAARPRLATVVICSDPAIPPYPARAALELVVEDATLELAVADQPLLVIGRAFEERRLAGANPSFKAGGTLGDVGAFAGGAIGGLLQFAGDALGAALETDTRIRARTSELSIDLHGSAPLPVRIREGATAISGPGFPTARSAEVTLRALLKWLTHVNPALVIDDSFEAAAARQKAVDPRTPLGFDEHSSQVAIIAALVWRRRQT
jgi:hypothetical protein